MLKNILIFNIYLTSLVSSNESILSEVKSIGGGSNSPEPCESAAGTLLHSTESGEISTSVKMNSGSSSASTKSVMSPLNY